jgi:hypothetical protein
MGIPGLPPRRGTSAVARGDDLTDPLACIPEHQGNLGPNRSIKPIDRAFPRNGHSISFVEAKLAGKKVARHAG